MTGMALETRRPKSPSAPSPWATFRRRLLASRSNQLCIAWLLLVALIAVLAPWLAPYDPTKQDLSNIYLPPGSDGHLFGTDNLGRDYLSRVLYGTRISSVAPIISVVVTAGLGIPLGLAAGYLGRVTDWVTSRVADALIAIPTLLLAIAIIAIFGPGLVNAMAAIGIATAPRLFRLTRAATIAVREETYIEASRMLGCSTWRIVFVHVLPNVRSPLLVQAAILMSLAFLAEAGLSFLGLGVQPPDASWGSLLREAFEYQFRSQWLLVPPAVLIVLTILALNVLGDGIRDAVGRGERRA